MAVARAVMQLGVQGLDISGSVECPAVEFGCVPDALDRGHREVPDADRSIALNVMEEAWTLAEALVGVRSWRVDDGRPPAIGRFRVREGEADAFTSASIPDAEGNVLLCAPWRAAGPLRLASMMAHEAMHQALFLRERQGSPVRVRSLGYSPWRSETRPGRMVWHAFWAFGVQFALLSEALTSMKWSEDDIEDVLALTVSMPPRLAYTLESLGDFNIVTRAEFGRCNEALAMIDDSATGLGTLPNFASKLAEAEESIDREHRIWAERLLAARRARV